MEKERILQAAFEVFSEKGFLKASIAEIAQRAKVQDSRIYKFFTNKEQLFYAVPGKYMEEILNRAKRELKGIRDATSMLSKIIWVQLDYTEQHKDITKIMLECRSHQEWYHSDAYSLVREYGSLVQGILEKGARDGVFRNYLNYRLIANIIFGTTDFENLSLLISREIDSQIEDLDDIVDLIIAMLEKKEQADAEPASKSARILAAAEQVISRHGFNKTKVLDIAKQAGVSEGTVYEYFKTKEDLLLAISAENLKKHMSRLDDAFEIRHPLAKLRRLIRYHFTLYLANRDFLKVFIINTQLRSNFFQSSAFETFREYYKVIESIVEEGKKEGVFRKEINPRIFRNMFLGAFSHISIRWFVLDTRSKIDMLDEIDQLTSLLSTALLTDKAARKDQADHGA